MHWGHGIWHWGHGWTGGLPMLLLWMLVFMLLARVMRWAFSTSADGNGGRMGSEEPPTILRRRYARGEIDKAEFEERRRELRN